MRTSGLASSHADPLDAGDDGGSSGGACGTSTVNGPIQTHTADTDVRQLVSLATVLDSNQWGLATLVGYGPSVGDRRRKPTVVDQHARARVRAECSRPPC